MEAAINDRSDYLKTRVHWAAGLFLIIDYSAKPSAHDWVFVQGSGLSGLDITPFRGWPFIGVVRELKPYQFVHLELESPASLPVPRD